MGVTYINLQHRPVTDTSATATLHVATMLIDRRPFIHLVHTSGVIQSACSVLCDTQTTLRCQLFTPRVWYTCIVSDIAFNENQQRSPSEVWLYSRPKCTHDPDYKEGQCLWWLWSNSGKDRVFQLITTGDPYNSRLLPPNYRDHLNIIRHNVFARNKLQTNRAVKRYRWGTEAWANIS